MNDPRAGRVGTACHTSGLSRAYCRCDDCLEYRVELKRWNQRLASEGLAVERGTSDYTAAQHRRRKAQIRKARHHK